MLTTFTLSHIQILPFLPADFISGGEPFTGIPHFGTINTTKVASESAVIYFIKQCNITARMIMSKSRLAPLKAVSIPRLELLGALIGLRLTRQVCSALKIPTNGVTYWVDNVNVGNWIQGQSREYKPFIAHRVGEIHEFSAPNQWRYVPTAVKPRRPWDKRPDSRRVSKRRLMVDWARISEEVKTRLARVQV